MTTILIVAANAVCFVLELALGDQFVMRWSVIPAQIVAGHHWITLLSAMFMHASWLHIIGNMVFLWAFGPAIEDTMGVVPLSDFLGPHRYSWVHNRSGE